MKFLYDGYDTHGKTVAGKLDAADPREAADILRAKGILAAQIRAAANESAKGPNRRRVPRKDVANFARQLSVLVATGTPLIEAITSIQEQTPPGNWRNVLSDLRAKVEGGHQLSEAMAQHPVVFDGIFRSLIAAGETGGKLDAMLDRLAALTRQQVKIQTTVQGALIYPALLVLVSVAVLGAMVGFVLPRFEGLFQTLGAALPPLTKFMLGVGAFVRADWPFLIGGLAAAAIGARFALRADPVLAAIDRSLISIPAVGRLVRGFAVARISRVLGVLLDGRVPMLDALHLTQQATGNREYAKLISDATDAVTKGDSLSGAFQASGLVSPSVCEAVRNGERSGRLPGVLVTLADFMDEDNEVAIKTIVGLVEPVILIGMGLLVGAVAISLFLPLFDLSAAGGGPRP